MRHPVALGQDGEQIENCQTHFLLAVFLFPRAAQSTPAAAFRCTLRSDVRIWVAASRRATSTLHSRVQVVDQESTAITSRPCPVRLPPGAYEHPEGDRQQCRVQVANSHRPSPRHASRPGSGSVLSPKRSTGTRACCSIKRRASWTSVSPAGISGAARFEGCLPLFPAR